MKLHNYGPVAQAHLELQANESNSSSYPLLPFVLVLFAGGLITYAWMLHAQQKKRIETWQNLSIENQNH